MKNVYFYFKTEQTFWPTQYESLLNNADQFTNTKRYIICKFVMYLMTISRKHRVEKASNKESKVGILIPNLLQINSVYLDKKPPFLVLGFLICKTRGLD